MIGKINKIFVISARTGCSCCCSENHYRGFYRSREDAERRITYYKSEGSKYWPLASQFARRGSYSVSEWEAEDLGDGRLIVNEDHVVRFSGFVEVAEDGSIKNNDSERLYISY